MTDTRKCTCLGTGPDCDYLDLQSVRNCQVHGSAEPGRPTTVPPPSEDRWGSPRSLGLVSDDLVENLKRAAWARSRSRTDAAEQKLRAYIDSLKERF